MTSSIARGSQFSITSQYIILCIFYLLYFTSPICANDEVTQHASNLISLDLELNSSSLTVISLKEKEHQMINFFLQNDESGEAEFILIERSSNDGMQHCALEPSLINMTAGLDEGSLTSLSDQIIGYINISGVFVGFSQIKFSYLFENKSTLIESQPVIVKVNRVKTVWESIFIGSVIVLVSIAYINMACTLDLEVIKRTVKRPIAPLIGLVSQYIFMPLFSFGLGYGLFRDRPEMWLGLFLTGCSPGGGGSNVWTYLLGGSLDLSITMTFISTIASYGAFPLWVYALGGFIPFYSGKVKLPYRRITMLIVGLIIPIGIGLLIKRFMPKVAVFLKKMLKPLAVFFIIFVTCFGVFAFFFIFYFVTWQVFVASICLPWFGFLFGLLLAVICRQSTRDIKAICIETGVQNTGLAIGVLQVALLDEAPMGDIGMLMPIMVATMTPVPLFIAYVITSCRGKKYADINNSTQPLESQPL